MLNDTSTIVESPVLRNACTTPGGMVRRHDLPGRHLDIAYRALLLEPHRQGPTTLVVSTAGAVHMIAAHLVRLSEHDMHVLLSLQFCIAQRLEHAATHVAMNLY